MSEKVILILIIVSMLIVGCFGKSTQQVTAEQLVVKEARLQLVEQTSLGNRDHIYLISVSGKEFIVVSNWVGGIEIKKVD